MNEEEYNELAKVSNAKLDDFPTMRLEKGETSRKAIVNQAEKKNEVNAPTIEDVKSIHGNVTLNVEQLSDLIKGQGGVIAEPSEDGKTIVIHLDAHSSGAPVLLPLTLTKSSSTFESTEVVDGTCHVLVEVEGTGIHSGASFDLPVYNGSVCLVEFSISLDGQIVDCYGHITAQDTISFQIPNIDDSYEVSAKYFIYEE